MPDPASKTCALSSRSSREPRLKSECPGDRTNGAQTILIWMPPMAPRRVGARVQNGGSRATAVTSDRHAARLAFMRVSEPIA